MTKYAYVLLTETPSRVGWAIRRILKIPFSHSSLGLDKEFENIYSFGRHLPQNPFVGGLIKETLFDLSLGSQSKLSCRIIRVPLNNKEYEKLLDFIKKIEDEEGKWCFNAIGFFGYFTSMEVKIDGTYFCSEFISQALYHTGLRLFKKPSFLITPRDFLKLPSNWTVYEGNLREYPHLCSKMKEEKDTVIPKGIIKKYSFFGDEFKKTISYMWKLRKRQFIYRDKSINQ